jgi:RNA polymerase sigma factor (TIGR02999 family)
MLTRVSDLTRLLRDIDSDPKAAEELLPLPYEELRKLAAQKMANEAPGQTLQPTALVHEAWLRIVRSEGSGFQNRAHFFGAAAEAMRRILVERARRRKVSARGGFAHQTEHKQRLSPMLTQQEMENPMGASKVFRPFHGAAFEL